MFLVSISVQNHNASICIMKNENVLLLVQQERVSRKKHDSMLPLKMLEYIQKYTLRIDYLCLVNITEEQINFVKNFLDINKIRVDETIIDNSEHHLFHASSAFYGSGFQDSSCLVIDGWGSHQEISKNIFGKETTSIYKISYPSNFDLVYKNLFVSTNHDSYSVDFTEIEKKFNYDIDISSHLDIGMMYGAVTMHIGFSNLDQGKTMGLFSYGKENKNIPNMLNPNTISSNKNLFEENRTLNTKLFSYLRDMDFQKKADLSFALQKSLEKIFIDRVQYVIEKTNCKNLVFSGGCALNVVGNSLIRERFPQVNFYVDPIANDACQSFGAAKYYYHKITKSNKIVKLNDLFLGPNYDTSLFPNKIKNVVEHLNHNKKISYK